MPECGLSAALTERGKGKTKRGFTGTINSRHERSEKAGERDPDKGREAQSQDLCLIRETETK